MQCTHCHTVFSPGEKFCGQCGHPVSVPVIPPSPSPARRGRAPVLLLVMGAVAVVFFLERSGRESPLLTAFGSDGNPGWIRQASAGQIDPLVARLISTPLPKNSYQGWNLTNKPEISEDKDPDEGQVGRVRAMLSRASGRGLGPAFDFNVFKTPAQARSSYEETTTSDRAGAGKAGGSMIAPSGITASCYAKDGRVAVCRALVGRTIVHVLFPDGESEQTAIASTRALVDHVAALDR
jgi:hypothetical protein